jgi:hypothetical protein
MSLPKLNYKYRLFDYAATIISYFYWQKHGFIENIKYIREMQIFSINYCSVIKSNLSCCFCTVAIYLPIFAAVVAKCWKIQSFHFVNREQF